MITEGLVWLIIALPVISLLVNGVLVRAFAGPDSKYAGYITVAAIGGSFVLSIWALLTVMSNGRPLTLELHDWIAVGGLNLKFGLMLDQLTVIMLVVVSGVSLLVQIYGQAYMHGDKSYTRYYAYMSLFTASMLGLVLSSNMIQLFVFWELVGISSYLLIGFWMDRPSAAAAAKKAFLMTRFGDFGFLLGILYLYSVNPSYMDIGTLYKAIAANEIAVAVATWVALGLFAGAVGKSAQFPLHSWLPDAMEGPTSVSALIHSATMVTAGVFLVARFFPLFQYSDMMTLVALVGGFTAVFAATMGLVANDIKRVLAYSTISQLGYMMLALGIGAYAPAIFHLFTHAFFKAALFLGAGSVHHASGTFNMKYMGGLKRHMPWTYWSMVIASVSLAGLFPFSGFWSKDEILGHAAEVGTATAAIVLALGLIAALMTAFYMFRVIFLTFHGEWRGGGELEEEHAEDAGDPAPVGNTHSHLAEAPWLMIGPVALLAVFAIFIGFFSNPTVDVGPIEKHAFAHFVTVQNEAVFPTDDAAVEAGASPEFNFVVAGASTVLALAGIGLAYLMYIRGTISPASVGARFQPVYRLLFRKYYVDELYEDQLVRKAFYKYIADALRWFDEHWIDNANVHLYTWVNRLGKSGALVQNGQTQTYAVGMVVGVIAIVAGFLLWG
ncbi:MAG: NADH-quinone oxidoreductase subunit L [Chloroflexi bacterium]|nr:NADH-quinone oxidoreductase subunit L [Chloroflexota bacterium]MCI0803597.1 NADH-quinone oxidoreductase subunit L [Chloroflexota bacterium]MCI0808191.1 NADH-quinone oxidoreductase subunit L [Chloroflexota bacterium]MCI0836004.1 NADH-quinone oxidoreductase subunit L [Chloroflexota bacterium]MCI0850589.1 NADH-quinone oxidoreductase subunit L [Chloroflexota bacterium]